MIDDELPAGADRAAAGDLTPSRAGLVDLVPRGRNADGCEVVQVPQAGSRDPGGFARCAAEPDVSIARDRYGLLFDDWYLWTARD